MKKAILIILTIFLTSGVWSCRSVKKDKTTLTEIVKLEEVKKEVETKKESEVVKEDTNVKKTENININSQTGTVTKTTITKPIDPTKPATITDSKGNKRTLENTELTEQEITTINNTLVDIKKSLEEEKKRLNEKHAEETRQAEELKKAESKKEAEQLNIKRTFPTWWIIGSLVALLAIIIGWYNRTKIMTVLKNIW